MAKMLAIVRRELIAYFSSPLAYMVLTAFLFVQGVIFYIFVYLLNRQMAGFETPLELFFGGTILFWLPLLFVVPVITMRLVAEELRSGTIELLLTSPLTESQVIGGKFLAAFIFYALLWLPTTIYVLLMRQHTEVDLGPVASQYLGVLLVGFLFLAVGTFASTLSRNQLIAAIMAFAMLIVLFFIPVFEDILSPSSVKSALAHMNLWDQMGESFNKGIVDSRHIVYPISAGLLFLFLAVKSLEARKGR